MLSRLTLILRTFFCQPRTTGWIYTLMNYFSNCVYLKNMYKISKGRTWKNSVGIGVDNFAKSVSLSTS